MLRLPPLVAAVAAVAISGCGEVAGAKDAARYSAELQPLNDSKVEGRVTFAREGEHLTVSMRARGLEPNFVHGQAIHGFLAEDRAAECPGEEFGAERIEAREGEREYGRRLRKLEPFPSADSRGRIRYRRLTFNVEPDELEPLETKTIVLRGQREGGKGSRYLPNLPVACGRLRADARAEP